MARPDAGRSAVLIEGTIAQDDAAGLSAALAASREHSGVRPLVMLDSGGGNVLAARALATLVQYGRLDTAVGPGAVCASACAVVFFAGAHRVVWPNARIGLHRAATPGGVETASTLATSWTLAKALRTQGAPQQVIDTLMATPPGQIGWLTRAELARIPGVVLVGGLAPAPPLARMPGGRGW